MNQTVKRPMLVSLAVVLACSRMLAQAPPAEHTTTMALLPTAPVIPADQQPTSEQLNRLFEVMRLRDQMESVTKMMPAMIQQQVEAQSRQLDEKLMPGVKLNADQQEASRKITQKYMEKAATIYPVSEIIDDMKSIYQRHVSRADVDAYIAFYSSAPAQRLLDAQPTIMQEYMPLVMKKVEQRSAQLSEELTQDLKDLVKSATPAGSGKN